MKWTDLKNTICCPRCLGSLDFKKLLPLSTDCQDVPCLGCNSVFSFHDGVLDFLGHNPHENSQASKLIGYQSHWEALQDVTELHHSEQEKNVFNEVDSSLEDYSIIDMGCGDGRHIPLLTSGKSKFLICVDSTNSVYNLSRTFGHQSNGTFVFFVRSDVRSGFLRPNSIDVIWCLGLINFFKTQNKLVSKFSKQAKHFIVLGVTSRNFFGSVYKMLNPIRTLIKYRFMRRLVEIKLFFIATCAYFFIKIYKMLTGHEHELFIKFLKSKNPVKSLRLALSEPFVSPKIYQLPTKLLVNLLQCSNFDLIEKKTDFLIDVFIFKKRSSSLISADANKKRS